MSPTQFVTPLFLLLSLVIALGPLRFAFTKASEGNVDGASGSRFRLAWTGWILIWGCLALLTTAGLPYGVPQTFRFLVLFVVPVLLGTALLLLIPGVRAAAAALPLTELVHWQRYRVVGGFFLVGAAAGQVSVPFALIAGVGDILVGAAAAITVRRMQQSPEQATRLAKAHAWLGMTDFTIAVGTALVTRAVIGWPYSLIPLFLVPMAILGHVATLQRRA